MASWMIRLAVQLQPLINLMREHQLAHPYIQADETRIQVLKEVGRSALSDKYMWVTLGGPPDQPATLFEYDPSRSKEVPLRLLEGFSSYLQTDGYANTICILYFLLPNPPELRDDEAATLTEFLYDIAMAAEMHYDHQLRRHYRKRECPRSGNPAEDEAEPF